MMQPCNKVEISSIMTRGHRRKKLAASKKKSQVKAALKDCKIEKKLICYKIATTTKNTFKKSSEYPETKYWLLQPQHGFCSNIMAPAAIYWRL